MSGRAWRGALPVAGIGPWDPDTEAMRAADAVLEAFRAETLAGESWIEAGPTTVDGDEVECGPPGRRVRGRMSGWLLLCGGRWAASAAATPFPRLVPALHSLGAAEAGYAGRRLARAVAPALVRTAAALVRSGWPEEAALCLRQAWYDAPAAVAAARGRTAALDALLDDAARPPALADAVAGSDGRIRFDRAVRAAAEALQERRATARLDASAFLRDFLGLRRGGDSATRADAWCGAALAAAVAADPEPGVRQCAAEALSVLARGLWLAGAYTEAATRLEALIEQGLGLGPGLCRLHECRLAAGDWEGAQRAWRLRQALEEIAPARGPLEIGLPGARSGPLSAWPAAAANRAGWHHAFRAGAPRPTGRRVCRERGAVDIRRRVDAAARCAEMAQRDQEGPCADSVAELARWAATRRLV